MLEKEKRKEGKERKGKERKRKERKGKERSSQTLSTEKGLLVPTASPIIKPSPFTHIGFLSKHRNMRDHADGKEEERGRIYIRGDASSIRKGEE